MRYDIDAGSTTYGDLVVPGPRAWYMHNRERSDRVGLDRILQLPRRHTILRDMLDPANDDYWRDCWAQEVAEVIKMAGGKIVGLPKLLSESEPFDQSQLPEISKLLARQLREYEQCEEITAKAIRTRVKQEEDKKKDYETLQAERREASRHMSRERRLQEERRIKNARIRQEAEKAKEVPYEGPHTKVDPKKKLDINTTIPQTPRATRKLFDLVHGPTLGYHEDLRVRNGFYVALSEAEPNHPFDRSPIEIHRREVCAKEGRPTDTPRSHYWYDKIDRARSMCISRQIGEFEFCKEVMAFEGGIDNRTDYMHYLADYMSAAELRTMYQYINQHCAELYQWLDFFQDVMLMQAELCLHS